MRRNEISKTTLKKINDNVDLLDESLIDFITVVGRDFSFYQGPGESNVYTLNLFLNNLVDGDWNEIFKMLKEERFLTWDYLDTFNSKSNSYSYDTAAEWFDNLTSYYRGGIINPGLGNLMDCDYYTPDFVTKKVMGNLSRSAVDCGVHLSAIRNCQKDFYTAVLVNKEKFPEAVDYSDNQPHVFSYREYVQGLSYIYSHCANPHSEDKGLIWIPVKDFKDFRLRGPDALRMTALPKDVLTSHSLPTVDHIEYEDIEFLYE